MRKYDGRGKRRADDTVLKQHHIRDICQEIIIRPDGSIEIPWFDPKATPLVIAILGEISGSGFPSSMLPDQNIYCG